MSNMYSDMGRFLQESFTIDNTFKKSTKRSLKESVKKSSKRLLKEDFDNQVTLPEVLGWLSEHDTAYEDCKRYFEVDFDDPNFDAKAEGITVDDLEDWISEHDSLWSDYVDYFELSEYLDESLKEDFSDARPSSTKIRNFIEMGADPAAILDELLRFLPDSALTDFADYYGENFLGTGDDWE